MEISLRKAHVLQTELSALINSIVISPVININEFQDAETVMSQARENIQSQISRKITLLDAVEKIRQAVSHVNFQCTIPRQLTIVASCQKQITFLEKLLSEAQVADTSELVNMKLARLRANVDSYRHDTITAQFLTVEMIDKIKNLLSITKARKAKAQDAIIELNSSNCITIDYPTYTMLKKENLIWD